MMAEISPKAEVVGEVVKMVSMLPGLPGLPGLPDVTMEYVPCQWLGHAWQIGNCRCQLWCGYYSFDHCFEKQMLLF